MDMTSGAESEPNRAGPGASRQTPILSLFSFAQDAKSAESLSKTDHRVLDAALELVGGPEGRVTVEQIAATSGVSRATVFRRFGNKDRILEHLVVREVADLFRDSLAAAANASTADDRAIQVISTFFTRALRHPLAVHLVRNDPQRLINSGSQGQPSLMDYTRSIIAELLRAMDFERGPQTQGMSCDMRADMLVHMVTGYAFLRTSIIDIDDEDVLREMATEITLRLAGPVPRS